MNSTIIMFQIKKLTILKALVIFITMDFTVGCQGPVGPSGKDVEGVDVTPPTIHLINPTPMSEVWGTFQIRAVAIDNVAVQEVIFYLDGGSVINGYSLTLSEPPYEKYISISKLDTGWHFLSARAIDTGNNITDTPIVPIKIGHPSSLRDTVVTKYHNSLYNETWTAPDSINTTTYWSRFSVARSCVLAEVSVMAAAIMSDTAQVTLQIWDGNELPVDMVAEFTFPQGEIDTVMSEKSLEFPADSLQISGDFFILLTMINNTNADTLKLGADSGDPPWGRSGSIDDDNLYYLTERFAVSDNLLISCKLFYQGASN